MDNKPKDNNFDKDDFYHNEGFVETQGPIGLKNSERMAIRLRLSS